MAPHFGELSTPGIEEHVAKKQKILSRNSDRVSLSKAESISKCSLDFPTNNSNHIESTEDFDSSNESAVPPHPLGVRPLGNAYDLNRKPNIKGRCGGFAGLPDELLLQILDYLAAKDLLRLGATCKAFYAFCFFDDLWKILSVEDPPNHFTWRGTWRTSYLVSSCSHSHQDSPPQPAISCKNLYSDVLYRPHYCAHTPLTPYTTNIPHKNTIPRLTNLTPSEFSAKWYDKPFILTDRVKTWPIYKKWDINLLLSKNGDVPLRAEAVDWPLRQYIDYMRNSCEEAPVYLFERSFVEKMRLKVPDASFSSEVANASVSREKDHESCRKDVEVNEEEKGYDYVPPPTFTPDYFTTLGSARPDHRWLIIGPARSGSSFHKDPNATSAWNAVIRGRKYWIMFPSSVPSSATDSKSRIPVPPPPPGTHPSPSGTTIVTPISIPEWFLSFHALARRTPHCREAICEEGEVLHVPSGWYHLVVNLVEGVAVTQNFVGRRGVGECLGFLRDCKGGISGFRDEDLAAAGGEEGDGAYKLFVNGLGEHAPDVLKDALRELEERDRAVKEREVEKKKSAWAEVKESGQDCSNDRNGIAGREFSFGFGGEDFDDYEDDN